MPSTAKPKTTLDKTKKEPTDAENLSTDIDTAQKEYDKAKAASDKEPDNADLAAVTEEALKKLNELTADTGSVEITT